MSTPFMPLSDSFGPPLDLGSFDSPFMDRVTIETPLGTFDHGCDHLHRHSYPELHGGAEFESLFWQRDLGTGTRENLGSFELDIEPRDLF